MDEARVPLLAPLQTFGATIALVACLIIATPAPATPPPTESGSMTEPSVPATQPVAMPEHEGTHYIIHSDVDEQIIREADVRLTLLVEEYERRTQGFRGAIDRKFHFYLFQNPDDYYAAGGIPGSAGMYQGQNLAALVGERERQEVWTTVQHEAFHQFAEHVIGEHLPIWVNEGLAEYFGESLFTGDGYAVGIVPPWRLERIKRRLADDEFIPSEELMDLTHEDWNEQIDLARYDQAWAIVHFLVHGENGRYHDAFVRFVRSVSTSRAPWREVWAEHFNSLDGFDQALARYWTNLPDHPTADLYAESCVRILTQFLARGSAAGVTYGSIDDLIASANNGIGDRDDRDWLPETLMGAAQAEMDHLENAGYVFLLDTSAPRPRVVAQHEGGAKTTGWFNLRGQHIANIAVRSTPGPKSRKQ